MRREAWTEWTVFFDDAIEKGKTQDWLDDTIEVYEPVTKALSSLLGIYSAVGEIVKLDSEEMKYATLLHKLAVEAKARRVFADFGKGSKVGASTIKRLLQHCQQMQELEKHAASKWDVKAAKAAGVFAFVKDEYAPALLAASRALVQQPVKQASDAFNDYKEYFAAGRGCRNEEDYAALEKLFADIHAVLAETKDQECVDCISKFVGAVHANGRLQSCRDEAGTLPLNSASIEALAACGKRLVALKNLVESQGEKLKSLGSGWSFDFSIVGEAAKKLGEVQAKVYIEWDTLFSAKGEVLLKLLPPPATVESPALLSDAAVRKTFVSMVQGVGSSAPYIDVCTLLRHAEDLEAKCGEFGKQAAGKGVLRKAKNHARLSVGTEWVVTKVTEFTPTDKAAIAKHATMITEKMTTKGFFKKGGLQLPTFLLKVLSQMKQSADGEGGQVVAAEGAAA